MSNSQQSPTGFNSPSSSFSGSPSSSFGSSSGSPVYYSDVMDQMRRGKVIYPHKYSSTNSGFVPGAQSPPRSVQSPQRFSSTDSGFVPGAQSPPRSAQSPQRFSSTNGSSSTNGGFVPGGQSPPRSTQPYEQSSFNLARIPRELSHAEKIFIENRNALPELGTPLKQKVDNLYLYESQNGFPYFIKISDGVPQVLLEDDGFENSTIEKLYESDKFFKDRLRHIQPFKVNVNNSVILALYARTNSGRTSIMLYQVDQFDHVHELTARPYGVRSYEFHVIDVLGNMRPLSDDVKYRLSRFSQRNFFKHGGDIKFYDNIVRFLSGK